MNQFKVNIEATYVALYRISTDSDRQHLSLDYQKDAITNFVDNTGGTIIREFFEQDSAFKGNREVFKQAVELCKDTESTLLVYKIDRLSRLGFAGMAMLEKSGIKYFEVLSPHDSEYAKSLKFLTAKEDNRLRRENILAGIGQVRRNIEKNGYHIAKSGKKITKLGKVENFKSTDNVKNSIISRKNKALNNPNNKRAAVVVELLLLQDASLRGMAQFLNSRGFETSQGSKFTATSVKNLMKLFDLKREKPKDEELINNKRAGILVELLLEKETPLEEIVEILNDKGFQTYQGCKFSIISLRTLMKLFKLPKV